MKIFVGSSTEAIDYLEKVAIWIEEAGHTAIPWNKENAFPLGEYTLDSLVELSNKVDGAIFIFSPDDKIWYRKDKFNSARDNVIFEYGLFSGSISKSNVIFCRVGEVKDLTDLSGITYVNLSQEALAKRKIKDWMKRVSQNEYRSLKDQRIIPMFNTNEAIDKTIETYARAVKDGGKIFATHIFSRVNEAISYHEDGSINEINDIALNVIDEKKGTNKLKFERVLLFTNQDLEKKWIEDTFKILREHSNINPCFYIPAQYPINPDDWFSGFSTKADLLLYSNSETHLSIFGFDSLISNLDNTFTSFSYSSKVYNRLLDYFNELTNQNLYFRPIKSLDDYYNARTLSHLSDGFHQIIDYLIEFSKKHANKICYLGLFGSIAKLALKHITKEQLNENDADIDFLVVAINKSSKEFIENELKSTLSKIGCTTTFGPHPCNDDFYPKRNEDQINIDIEIVLKGDNFYQKNKLLGYSIGRYLYRLFSWENKEAGFFVRFPNIPLNTHSSYKELLNSRKGLLDFQKIITNKTDYDPKRIISLVLRNIAWADSGHYPESTQIAIDYLKKYEITLKSFKYDYYEDFCYNPDFDKTEIIVKDAISLAYSKLGQPNKALHRTETAGRF
jgi:hypothetical protein